MQESNTPDILRNFTILRWKICNHLIFLLYEFWHESCHIVTKELPISIRSKVEDKPKVKELDMRTKIYNVTRQAAAGI